MAALTCGGIGAPARSDYPRIDLVTTNGQARLVGRNHIWESLSWSVRGDQTLPQLELPAETAGRTRYTCALEYFIGCLRQGIEPELSPESGIASVRLVTAIYRSMRQHRQVNLRELAEG